MPALAWRTSKRCGSSLPKPPRSIIASPIPLTVLAAPSSCHLDYAHFSFLHCFLFTATAVSRQSGHWNGPDGSAGLRRHIERLRRIGRQQVSGMVLEDGAGSLQSPRYQPGTNHLQIHAEEDLGGEQRCEKQADIGQEAIAVMQAVHGKGDRMFTALLRRVLQVHHVVFGVSINAHVALLHARLHGLNQHAVFAHEQCGMGPVGELVIARPW